MDTRGPGSAGSAATRAYDRLKQGILERVYEGGTLLSEGAVAEAVGVSRTPVREALLRLEAEGLVRLYPKRGALVLPVSAAEVEEVFQARELVEGFAAPRAWARRAALATRLEALLDTMRASRDARDAPTLTAADRAFHAAIVEASGNSLLTAWYESLRDRQMRMGVAALLTPPERTDRIVAEHVALLEALGDDDPARFADLLRAHITSAAAHLKDRP